MVIMSTNKTLHIGDIWYHDTIADADVISDYLQRVVRADQNTNSFVNKSSTMDNANSER